MKQNKSLPIQTPFPKDETALGHNSNSNIKGSFSSLVGCANISGDKNIEAIIRSGETRSYLNSTGKTMIEDLKDFSIHSAEFFNNINEKTASEYHSHLKFLCKTF